MYVGPGIGRSFMLNMIVSRSCRGAVAGCVDGKGLMGARSGEALWLKIRVGDECQGMLDMFSLYAYAMQCSVENMPRLIRLRVAR